MNESVATISIESLRPPLLNGGGAEKAPAIVQTQGTEEIFRQLASQWRKETAHLSLVVKKVMHPAYQRIIGLGPAAVPLLLQELQQQPGHWTWALRAITGEDPTHPDDTVTQAAQAWVKWGQERNYL